MSRLPWRVPRQPDRVGMSPGAARLPGLRRPLRILTILIESEALATCRNKPDRPGGSAALPLPSNADRDPFWSSATPTDRGGVEESGVARADLAPTTSSRVIPETHHRGNSYPTLEPFSTTFSQIPHFPPNRNRRRGPLALAIKYDIFSCCVRIRGSCEFDSAGLPQS